MDVIPHNMAIPNLYQIITTNESKRNYDQFDTLKRFTNIFTQL